MLRVLAGRLAQKQQAWNMVPISSQVLCSQAPVSSQEFASGAIQHLHPCQVGQYMSASESAMVPATQHCSTRIEQSPGLELTRPFSASAPGFSATSVSRHHSAQPAAEVYHSRRISSTPHAAESMSKDKTDLSAGAATAAAAHTMQQQPSAHGLQAAPQIANFLGFAGAIPFLALAPPIAQSLPFLPADLVANAALLQLGYGASIASFLGGIHWAMAMAEYGGPVASAKMASERYIWSVTPCLMAWPAVALQSGPGSLIMGTVLGVVYAVDRSFAAKGLLPAWYMALRLPLTLAAVSGMMITLVGSFMMAPAYPPQ